MAQAGGRGQVPLSQRRVEKCPALGKEGGRGLGVEGRHSAPPTPLMPQSRTSPPAQGPEVRAGPASGLPGGKTRRKCRSGSRPAEALRGLSAGHRQEPRSSRWSREERWPLARQPPARTREPSLCPGKLPFPPPARPWLLEPLPNAVSLATGRPSWARAASCALPGTVSVPLQGRREQPERRGGTGRCWVERRPPPAAARGPAELSPPSSTCRASAGSSSPRWPRGAGAGPRPLSSGSYRLLLATVGQRFRLWL